MFFIIKRQSIATNVKISICCHLCSSLNGAKILAFVYVSNVTFHQGYHGCLANEIESFQNLKNIYCGSKSTPYSCIILIQNGLQSMIQFLWLNFRDLKH